MPRRNASRRAIRSTRRAVRSLLQARPQRRGKPRRPPQAPRPQPPPAPPAKSGNVIGTIGRAAGDFLLPGLGSVTETIGNAIGNFFGFSRRKKKFQTRAALPEGCVRVAQREYLGEVNGSTGFVNNNKFINPGLASTFPFLSRTARNYQEYQFEHVEFEFKSKSANALNSTNTALGTVVTATNYNCCEPNWTSKAQMEVTTGVISEKPSVSQIHGLDVRPSQTPLPRLYVRSQAVPNSQDQHLYDLANFQIATQGMQAVADVGELWVDYSCLLFKPRIDASSTGSFFHLTTTTGSASTANPLGASANQIADPQNTLQLTYTTSTIVLPNMGTFLINYALTGGTGIASPGTSAGSNISGYNYFQNFGGPSAGTFNAGGTSAQYSVVYTVNTAGTGTANMITFSATATTGFADVTIVAIPNTPSVAIDRIGAVEQKMRDLLARLHVDVDEKTDESPVIVPPPPPPSASSLQRGYFR